MRSQHRPRLHALASMRSTVEASGKRRRWSSRPAGGGWLHSRAIARPSADSDWTSSLASLLEKRAHDAITLLALIHPSSIDPALPPQRPSPNSRPLSDRSSVRVTARLSLMYSDFGAMDGSSAASSSSSSAAVGLPPYPKLTVPPASRFELSVTDPERSVTAAAARDKRRIEGSGLERRTDTRLAACVCAEQEGRWNRAAHHLQRSVGALWPTACLLRAAHRLLFSLFASVCRSSSSSQQRHSLH